MPGTLHALQRAIAAIRAGDKTGGQRLLAEVIRNDPRNEAAWLWMSAALDSDEQRRTCLERVLAINPDNPTAQRGLASLGPTFGRTGPTAQPPIPSPPGASPEPAGSAAPARPAPSLVRPPRRARAVLPGWSLLIAFGATAVVCATIGIAAYLALAGTLGFLRSQAARSIGPRGKAAHSGARHA
jgi:hypothetical protein